MTAVTAPDFEEIVADMTYLDGWEERYKFVIDLGRQLPPLDDSEYDDAHKVRGCASQVWLAFDRKDGRLNIRGDSDAHIVKGLVAVLVTLFSGKTPEEVSAIDAEAELARMDLQDHLTPQRSNGLASMIARIRAEAGAA